MLKKLTFDETRRAPLFYGLEEISVQVALKENIAQKSREQKYLADCEEEEIEDYSSDEIKPNIILTNVNNVL